MVSLIAMTIIMIFLKVHILKEKSQEILQLNGDIIARNNVRKNISPWK